MPDSSRSPTREQLLDVRRQAKLVFYGKELLEKKRDSLVRAIEEERRRFRECETFFKERLAALWRTYSRLLLTESTTALSLLLPVPLRKISTRIQSLMGCRYPVFTPTPDSAYVLPSYDPALASVYMDELTEGLVEIDKLFWPYANMRAKLAALEKELSRTLVKINTLDHILLPELRRDESRIKDVLSERERQERFFLKRLMRKKIGQGK